MSETLYKAVFHYGCADSLTGNSEAVALNVRVAEWLVDNHRVAHYVNAYLNCSSCDAGGELVVVLRDRDTALMLKLALA